MRRYLRRLLAILDGAPTLADKSPTLRRGQSLVEITLLMPILLIMLLGLIEIGWLANNFLILLDVSREAGRFGALSDPLEWRSGEEANLERMDCDQAEGGSNSSQDGRSGFLPIQDLSHLTDFSAHFSDGADSAIGYYDGVACTAIRYMDPLIFDPAADDVVVSVFNYIVRDFDGASGPQETTVRVSGRFPAQQNECADEAFDPFDMNRNGNYDVDVEDAAVPTKWDAGGENIRGYVLTGHHRVSDNPDCIGSEFSMADVETLLNGASSLENENSPNNGLLLVEMFWHHRQLLQLRWFTIIGDNFEIHVWSIYPSTSAEPTATP